MMSDETIDQRTLARRIARVARCFDATGRLIRWPKKLSEQTLALWIIWSQLPADGQMDEQEINAMLRTWHDFEDYVLLRRELIELDLLRRTPDGRIYRRVSHQMPPEAQALEQKIAASNT